MYVCSLWAAVAQASSQGKRSQTPFNPHKPPYATFETHPTFSPDFGLGLGQGGTEV